MLGRAISTVNERFGRRAVIWGAILTALALLLDFVPLFDLLGYDFSFAVGLCAALAAADIGHGVVAAARARAADGRRPRARSLAPDRTRAPPGAGRAGCAAACCRSWTWCGFAIAVCSRGWASMRCCRSRPSSTPRPPACSRACAFRAAGVWSRSCCRRCRCSGHLRASTVTRRSSRSTPSAATSPAPSTTRRCAHPCACFSTG